MGIENSQMQRDGDMAPVEEYEKLPSFETAWTKALEWPEAKRQMKMDRFALSYAKATGGRQPDAFWIEKQHMECDTLEWYSETPFTLHGAAFLIMDRSYGARELAKRLLKAEYGFREEPYAFSPSDLVMFVALCAFFRRAKEPEKQGWYDFELCWLHEESMRVRELDEKLRKGVTFTLVACVESLRQEGPFSEYLRD